MMTQVLLSLIIALQVAAALNTSSICTNLTQSFDIVLDINVTVENANIDSANSFNITQFVNKNLDYVFSRALLHDDTQIATQCIQRFVHFANDNSSINSYYNYLFQIGANFSKDSDFDNFILFYEYNWFEATFSYLLETNINRDRGINQCYTKCSNNSGMILVSEQMKVSYSYNGDTGNCNVSPNTLFFLLIFDFICTFYFMRFYHYQEFL